MAALPAAPDPSSDVTVNMIHMELLINFCIEDQIPDVTPELRELEQG